MHHFSSKSFLFLLPLLAYAGAVVLLDPHMAHAAGNTYYISPGESLQNAVNQLQAGDTLIMHGGRYTAVEVDITASGTSWSNPVTIRPATGETVTIALPAGEQDPEDVLDFADGAQYIILSGPGLIIDADSNTLGSAVGFGGAHHIRIQDVEIKNAGSQCVHTGGGTFLEFINVNAHHCGFRASSVSRGHGYYIPSSDVTIDGGEIHDNGDLALQIYVSGGCQCDRFTIRNARVYNNALGIGLFHGSNHKVYNNLVYNNGG